MKGWSGRENDPSWLGKYNDQQRLAGEMIPNVQSQKGPSWHGKYTMVLQGDRAPINASWQVGTKEGWVLGTDTLLLWDGGGQTKFCWYACIAGNRHRHEGSVVIY